MLDYQTLHSPAGIRLPGNDMWFRIVIIPVVKSKGIMPGGGFEIGALTLDFRIAGICICSCVRHKYLSVGPELEGSEVGLRMPHAALSGLYRHYNTGIEPAVPESIETCIRMSGGFVCRGHASLAAGCKPENLTGLARIAECTDIFQKLAVGKIVMASGIAETGMSAIGILIIQIIIRHPNKLFKTLLRK